ncbi:unnamed protein product [Cylicocyclus nassatus]|uniref:Protein-tyrosine sulfotransferase n=1 Tax=Cylicocyclus nassatus TaxID=53992 RepID=A0AA36GY19_CYLNA|nr:unnamed protein product [Cylicocyclus nassatus]
MGRPRYQYALIAASLGTLYFLFRNRHSYHMQMCGLLSWHLLSVLLTPGLYNDQSLTLSTYETDMIVSSQRRYLADANSSLIFIGGLPRSGTPMMRIMLDSHPDVRCGKETRIIPKLLHLVEKWRKSDVERNRLDQAQVSDDLLKRALASFIVQIIDGQGKSARRLCSNDPSSLNAGKLLSEMFPNARFIFMIRDGRATIQEIIEAKANAPGFNTTNHRECMTYWNKEIKDLLVQCNAIGKRCLKVYYEEFLMYPQTQIPWVLKFLDLPTTQKILDIYKAMTDGKLEQLRGWIDRFPDDVLRDVDKIAPMLRYLGYNSNPPKYGTAEELMPQRPDEPEMDG